MSDGYETGDPHRAIGGSGETGLDQFFAAYRGACPDLDASPDFMPRLWARIEGREHVAEVFAWRRWAQAFLSLAAAASLLIVLLQVFPRSAPVFAQSTYVDQLSEADGPEQLLSREVASTDSRQSHSQSVAGEGGQ